MSRRPEGPPRPWLAFVYAALACGQLGTAITQAAHGGWLVACYAAGASVAWLVLALVQRRLELAWTLLQGLQVAVGIRDRDENITYGVVRTNEPASYLLHDQTSGHRFRLTEHGTWQREDW